MNRRYLIVAFTCLLCGKAFAFPQYRLDLQSSLAPGPAPMTGINKFGATVKNYQSSTKILLRTADAAIKISDAVPSPYFVDSTQKAISLNGRVFADLKYVVGPGERSKTNILV